MTRQSRRMSLRSPTQPAPANTAMAFRCRCWRTRRRSASSTVAFLVASPDAAMASAKSLSSISILVRTARRSNVYNFIELYTGSNVFRNSPAKGPNRAIEALRALLATRCLLTARFVEWVKRRNRLEPQPESARA